MDSPMLLVKEISDPYVRKNFENLSSYFKQNNQLLSFNFLEVTFEGAGQKLVSHGLGYIPKDILRCRIIGTGSVSFDYASFDSKNISISSTGPVSLRFFVGTFFNDPAGNVTFQDKQETWSASQSETSSSSSAFNVKTISSLYTALKTDDLLLVNTTISGFDLLLPDVRETTKPLYLKLIGSGSNAVVVRPNKANTIDGATSLSISTQYTHKILYPDFDKAWYVF